MDEATHFAICIYDGEYAGALEVRKVYEVLEDAAAGTRNYVRVIDESGEDYLYPAFWFVTVALPESVERRLHEIVVG